MYGNTRVYGRIGSSRRATRSPWPCGLKPGARSHPGILLTGEIGSMALLRSGNNKVSDYALVPSMQAISRPGSKIGLQPIHEYKEPGRSSREGKKNG